MVGWTYYSTFNQPWRNVVNMSLLYRRCEDVAKLTPRFQRCNDVVNATFMVFRELNLISSVEATLEQRCIFEVVASRLCKRCETDASIRPFEQCYQYNMHRILWVEVTLQCCSNICSLLQFEHCDINVATTLYIGSATLQSYHNNASPFCFCWNVIYLSTL